MLVNKYAVTERLTDNEALEIQIREEGEGGVIHIKKINLEFQY